MPGADLRCRRGADKVARAAQRLRCRGAVRARETGVEEVPAPAAVGGAVRRRGCRGGARLIAFRMGHPRDGERFRCAGRAHSAHARGAGCGCRELLAGISRREDPFPRTCRAAGAQLAGGERPGKHGERGGARRSGKAGDHRSPAGRRCDGVALRRHYGDPRL